MADMLPANTFSPELTARIEAIAQEGYDDWNCNSSAEQKAVGFAWDEKFMSDQEFGAAEMAKSAEMWGASDANADGLLDEAECKVFSQKQREYAASTGNYAQEKDGYVSKLYAICNDVNPATPAVAMADYLGVMGVYMQKC